MNLYVSYVEYTTAVLQYYIFTANKGKIFKS